MSDADSDRRRAARVLARAFPSWSERSDLASAAGLTDVQLAGDAMAVWRTLVDEAVDQGRYAALVRAAGRRRPEHPGVVRLLGAVDEGRIAPAGLGTTPSRLVAAAAVLAGLLAVAWVWTGSSAVDAEDASGADALAVAPEDAQAAADETPTPDDDAQPPPSPPAQDDGAAAAPEPSGDDPGREDRGAVTGEEPGAVEDPPPEPAPAAEPAPVVEERADATPTPTPASTGGVGPCDGAVGWAYAGDAGGPADGLRAGEVFVTPQAVNVRQAPPLAENGWSPRTPRVCVLPAGARVTLGRDALSVAGGAVWVEVRGEAVGLP